MKYIIHLITILLLTIPTISQSQKQKSIVSTAKLDSLFAEWDDASKPGIAVGVVNNGKIEHLRAYGSANLEHNIPITPQTKFLYTGMSDQMIVYMLLLLQEKGVLSLDDNINKYVPTLHKNASDIKIKHLISHTSGIHNLEVIKQFAGLSKRDFLSKDQANEILAKQKTLNHEPGSTYQYNKTESGLMQDIIEKTTGKSIVDASREMIFSPLNMTNTMFTKSSDSVIHNKAQGYYKNGDNYTLANPTVNEGEPALLYSTVEDMCKWAQNLTNPIIGSTKILSKFESLVEVNNEPVEQKNTALYIGQHGYWNYRGLKKLYLIGMKDGYACKLIRYIDEDLSIVVMGNAGSYNGGWATISSDLYLTDFFEKPKDQDSKKIVKTKLSQAQKEKYCGTYWNKKSLYTTEITLENDTLRYFEKENNWKINLIPQGENKFVTHHNHTVEFNKVDGLTELVFIMPNGTQDHSMYFDGTADWTKNLQAYEGVYESKTLNSKFEVKYIENKLYLTHHRLGKMEMFPLHKNTFKTNNTTFKEITFDKSNKSLSISNRYIRDYKFAKNESQLNYN